MRTNRLLTALERRVLAVFHEAKAPYHSVREVATEAELSPSDTYQILTDLIESALIIERWVQVRGLLGAVHQPTWKLTPRGKAVFTATGEAPGAKLQAPGSDVEPGAWSVEPGAKLP